ncbi:MAG: NAD-dependent epimerase/dehydratase family protein [Methanomicrobiales archaeon]|nr:NAD-dependent epimerase/dehydratase family protein [Methanomicrobiales archaeon]
MRVLVTGAVGFSGARMMEILAAQQGVEPVGLVHRPIPATVQKKDSFVVADLLNTEQLSAVVLRTNPDALIHLAGLTYGTASELYATNVTGTKNLLDATISVNPDCRVLVVSSSAVYGYAGNQPIPETAPVKPVGEYGRSKVAQEDVCRQFSDAGAEIAIARPFNLAGPLQSDAFVCGRIVDQVIRIEQKKSTAIELREILSSRDIIDVRDVVKGYFALISCPDFSSDCSGKVFNLGSGNPYPVSTIIALIEEITGSIYKLQLSETHPAIAVLTQRSDNSRITELTGWRPEISLKETLADMLAAARGQVPAHR